LASYFMTRWRSHRQSVQPFWMTNAQDDTELRREVESLLASHDQSPTFIAKPAIAMAAELLVDNDADEFIGKPVGRYVVRSLLGIGGMGRVYLAEDLELGRRVALKLLLKQLTHDQTQLQRFRQEARAASALNHPNILTVHEIGQVAGTYFIATEYVDGDTLRDRLQRSPLSLPEAIEIAIQIADALSAAHAVGIVHRDIKPENVMLRRDGYVKVLDFGLAKLTEKVTALQGPASQGSTLGTVRTDSGVIMGTVNYMSPEQIRGVGVDVRTDIWSLGVLLYELVARRPPLRIRNAGRHNCFDTAWRHNLSSQSDSRHTARTATNPKQGTGKEDRRPVSVG
jgi:serine/threonine protein kinase